MKDDAWQTVKLFEKRAEEYTGSPYAVSVDTCTAAIFLCCKYLNVKTVKIPCRTHVSVPCSVIHAGGTVEFEDKEWRGCYELEPYPIVDSAVRFTSGMYQPGKFVCVSFQYKKPLPIGRGGMILTDDPEATKWFMKARCNGRGECSVWEDSIEMIGWNYYMDPERAARGLAFLDVLPKDNPDKQLPYPDLTAFPAFRGFPRRS
jgi:dTDP-4-amino-4,6-dideoxygalactose transaminase